MATRHLRLTPGLLAGVLAAACFLPSTTIYGQAQKADGKAPAQAAQVQDDGPVAVTAGSRKESGKDASKTEVKETHVGMLSWPAINNKGEVVFLGRIMKPGESSVANPAYFTNKSDGSWNVFITGQKGTNFDAPLFSLQNMGISNKGDFAFTGALDKPAPCLVNTADEKCGADSGKMAGIFAKTAEGVKSIALVGQEIPNNPSRFVSFSSPSINSKGDMSFIGTYFDTDGRGLFIMENGKLKLVARSGQRTPAGADTHYTEHFSPSGINERGEVAFFCRISGGGAIFVRRPTGIEAIAIQGNDSPVAGAKYIGFSNRTPAINDKGDVVFAGFIGGEQVSGRMLFLHSNGKTSIVAKSGETLPESLAKFSDFNMPSINNNGDIVFVGNYEGRSRGIFLKTAKGIEAIALYDKQAPGFARTEQNVFNNFLNPVINDNGDIAFLAQLRGATTAIFVKRKGEELKAVMKAGDPLPATK